MNNEWGRIKPKSSWSVKLASQAFRLHPPGELPIGSTLSHALWGTCRSLAQDRRMEDGEKQDPKIFCCNKSRHDLGQITSPYPSPSSIWGGATSANLIFFWCPTGGLCEKVRGVLFVKETLRGLTWLWPLHRTFRRAESQPVRLAPNGANSCWQRNYCKIWVVSFFFSSKHHLYIEVAIFFEISGVRFEASSSSMVSWKLQVRWWEGDDCSWLCWLKATLTFCWAFRTQLNHCIPQPLSLCWSFQK